MSNPYRQHATVIPTRPPRAAWRLVVVALTVLLALLAYGFHVDHGAQMKDDETDAYVLGFMAGQDLQSRDVAERMAEAYGQGQRDLVESLSAPGDTAMQLGQVCAALSAHRGVARP